MPNGISAFLYIGYILCKIYDTLKENCDVMLLFLEQEETENVFAE